MKLSKLRNKGVTFTTFLQIGFSATIIFTIFLFGSMYYGYSSKLLTENIQGLLRSAAISSQYIIDGDKHEKVTDSKGKEYKEMCYTLAEYKEELGVYDVYTMIRADETHTKLVLAAYDAESTFMKSYIYTDEMKEAFNGKISVTDTYFTDDFGTFYSGYAPLRNSKNEIVAIIGIDINIGKVRMMKKEIINTILLLFFICFVVGNLLVYLVAKLIGNNYKSLISDIKKIGYGDLSISNNNKLSMISEMKDLGHTINEMAERISYLIQIITKNSKELKMKANEISGLINTTDTSSQIIASAVEQMSNVHKNASVSFDESLNELVLYKEDSKSIIGEHKVLLSSIETTKDSIENILQYLRKLNVTILNSDNRNNNKISMKIIEEFKIYCEKLYKDYDLFTENINSQLFLLDKVSERGDNLVELNNKISSDFKDISQGNQRILEVLERQVKSIYGVVKEVGQLENMAEELNRKLDTVKTRTSI